MRRYTVLATACAIGLAAAAVVAQEWKSGIVWPEPKVVDPGPPGGPPADAVVLFDGKDMSKWVGGESWDVHDGYATARRRSIRTKDAFGDCQLHVEFATPAEVKGSGQGRGNSGVFLMGKYEVQVLDTYGTTNKTYADGQAAALYGQYPPLVNPARPPGQWNTYDIVFRAPRFDAAGKVTNSARVTVLFNGVLVQDARELSGPTAHKARPPYAAHAEKLPLGLQDHSHPVRFRNIWIRELAPEDPTLPRS
jgi:hypothetical protein